MEMHNDRLIALLEKYLSGNCSPEEKLALEEWYDRFETKGNREADPTGEAFQSGMRYDEIISRLKRENAWIENVPEAASRKGFARKMIGVAAILLIMLGGALGLYWLLRRPAALHLQSVVAKAGEHKYIKLGDGSLIWLSPASELKYPEDFSGQHAREVSLSGEAFFEIAKDPDHPFIIHTGEINTQVLGTSFNIQAYAGSGKVLVTVVTGKVQVRPLPGQLNGGKVLDLLPDQRAVYRIHSKGLEKEEFPNAGTLMMGRKEGRLVYRGAPLADVIGDIGRYYDKQILSSKRIAGCTFFGDIDMNDGLDKVMNQILLMLNNANLKKEGSRYILDADPCAP
jgi:ferric-dicitrate binding protein FerR (iron transport regulator)